MKLTALFDLSTAPELVEEAQIAIVKALEKEPRLHLNGYPVRRGYYRPQTPFQHAAYEHENRAAFFSDGGISQVATAIIWLDQITKVKTPTVSSYGLKHEAERWGRANGFASYVSNGAMLAAAIYRGVPMKRISNSPNAAVGVSSRRPPR